LVKQLKARKANGETNLMIAGNKTVERKQRTSSKTQLVDKRSN
jgi:hypothetical protein